MPEGGTLTLSAALDGGAAAGLQEGGPWLRLRVADTGTGMDAATLERASEPFFSTKGGRRGTGLGLAMARGFAEQSGGAMAIESEPGRGTAVSLWLPAAEIPVETARPAAVARSAAGLPRVLLVDDEALVCEITAEQLESEGFAVMRAASGPAALALLEAGETVDIVISDLSMPGMDGLALVRDARRRRHRLPAILLTGYATDAAEIAVAGVVSGEFSLLRKPVDAKVLAGRVAEMLAAAPAA
jgi:CheY-like chemotaxis protein